MISLYFVSYFNPSVKMYPLNYFVAHKLINKTDTPPYLLSPVTWYSQ